MSNISLNSEIGRLRTILVHEPGQEIENITPATAADALYDDILFLEPAQQEHRYLTAVLSQIADVHQLTDLLVEVLQFDPARQALIRDLCALYDCGELVPELDALSVTTLAKQLITGTRMHKDTLAKFLSPLHYALPPLPNTFFMRDATMCVNDRVIIGAMANKIRMAEALLLRTVFRHHPVVQGNGFYFDGTQASGPLEETVTIEGGDILVLREDLVVIGYSERTSAKGIDILLQELAQVGQVRDVIVVELPKMRATIHLDMIFTMVDRTLCVIYPPLITDDQRGSVIHVAFADGRISSIEHQSGLIDALERLGMPLTPIACGGPDPLRQDREQWASGANFFALAPGKVIGYERNRQTFAELKKHGFEILSAEDIATGKANLNDHERCAVAMPGEELNRGGGGCRCMTLPVYREPVAW